MDSVLGNIIGLPKLYENIYGRRSSRLISHGSLLEAITSFYAEAFFIA
jgi:hypothetical protein